MDQDIRWRQRFENFRKSLDLLQSAVEIKNPDKVFSVL